MNDDLKRIKDAIDAAATWTNEGIRQIYDQWKTTQNNATAEVLGKACVTFAENLVHIMLVDADHPGQLDREGDGWKYDLVGQADVIGDGPFTTEYAGETRLHALLNAMEALL